MEIIASVVIPTYNRAGELKQCLEALAQQDYPSDGYELIVVDDGSTDKTQTYVQSACHSFDNFKCIRQNNLGHALARRRGFQEAKGEIVASLDDDCIPSYNWMRTIVEKFQSDQNLSICCGRIINPTQTKIAWAQYLIDYSLWIGNRNKKNIPLIYTANTAYRRNVLMEGTLRADGKLLGYRDIMYNYEIVKIGYRTEYCHDMVVKHIRWEKQFSHAEDEKKIFIQGQERHGKGFRKDGYKVYGLIGKAFLKLPTVFYIVIKAFLISFRAWQSGVYIKYISSFRWIWRGLYHQALFIKRDWNI